MNQTSEVRQTSSKSEVEMRNLRQLECHLTKLHYFISDMDQASASLAYGMISLSLFQFFYSVFILINFWSTNLLIAFKEIVDCLFQLVGPFVLFEIGDLMESEAKRLLVTLEVMYLQNPSKELIQKHYGRTMSSLMRVFRVLNRMKYNCDNLMAINLGTMKKFIFYTLTFIFIVVQYGKWIYKGSPLECSWLVSAI